MTKKPVNLFSVDTWKDVLDQALNFQAFLKDPSQMSAKAGAELQNLGDTSHELEAEKINAIKQKTSKGFKIADINPNYLNRSDYYCVYDDTVIFQCIGSDLAFEEPNMKYDNEGSPVPGQRTQSPYFRTVQIPIEGNWVKIEYLPVRKNVSPTFAFTLPEDVSLQPTVEPQNTLEVNNTYQSSATYSSDSPILLEFESPQGKPHLVRSGDSFETYFTNLIITLKQNSPPVRITVGFNSQIHSASDNTPTSLSLWKGNGLLKESSIQSRAWHITDTDTNAASNAGYAYANSELRIPIIANDFGPPLLAGEDHSLGLHVGWITEFSANSLGTTLGDLNSVDVDIMICWGGVGVLFLRYLEKLATVTLTFGTNSPVCKGRWQGNEPIRYQLRNGEVLAMRFRPGRITPLGSPSQALIKFSVGGYSIGRLEGILPGLAKVNCLSPIVYLTENPYPVDLERYGAPKS